MEKTWFYYEVDGLAEDESGNPCPGGIGFSFSADGTMPDSLYMEFAERQRPVIVEMFEPIIEGLTLGNVRPITEEYYMQHYGDDTDDYELGDDDEDEIDFEDFYSLEEQEIEIEVDDIGER